MDSPYHTGLRLHGMANVMDELREELETFEVHRDALRGRALNEYVLIHGSKILGTFQSERDAIAQGYTQLGNVPFLVKQVVDIEKPLNFVSGLVRL